MKPIHQIYHQIRWDARFQPGDYRLGVSLRGGGTDEIPLPAFDPQGDVPWHRILYVTGPAGLVWDRRTGLDQLLPAEADSQPFWPLEVVCWNLCAAKHGLPLAERREALLSRLLPPPAAVTVLLEAGDEICQCLPITHRCQDLALLSARPPRALREIELSRGKQALLVDFGAVRLAVAHFTSDFRGSAARRRAEQWAELWEHLEPGPWLVVGDLNAGDDEVLAWGRDLTPPGWSFDPDNNPLARRTTRSGRPGRYQRILASSDLKATGSVEQWPGSDHFPLRACVEPDLPQAGDTTHRSALAILPPAWPEVQALRARHDPAFARWMPHLNLLYPGPPRPDLDALREALADQERFPVRFESMERFAQGTVYWKPDDASCQRLRTLRRALGLEGNFQPHLTLGRGSFQATLPPREFEVRCLVHLVREDGPFRVAQAIPLRTPHPLYPQLRSLCPEPPLMVGSALWEAGQDLDLVARRLDPERLRAAGLREAGSAWRGAGCDLSTDWKAVLDRDALWTRVYAYGSPTQGGSREGALPPPPCADEHFADHLRSLYDWLAQRGLRGQAWGYPGGLAWSVLLARWGWPDLLRRAADWNWREAVGLEDDLPAADRPMTVWSPAPPPINLTRHVPAFLLEVLRANWTGRERLPGQCLHIDGDPQGEALGLVVDLHKRLGLTVRPWVRPDGCDLYLEGDAQAALDYARERLPAGLKLRI